MQQELEALQPQLKIAANETMQMMRIIEEDTIKVEATKTLLQEDEKVAKIQAEAATELKDECERDLRVAEPALDGILLCYKTDINILKLISPNTDVIW